MLNTTLKKKNKWGEKKREFISFLIHIVFKNTS